MPLRIQLRRTKGWRMPENTVKVDRTTEWGNRYKPGAQVYRDAGFGKVRDAAEAVVLFARHELHAMQAARLRGKNLGCWCSLCDAHKDGKPFDVDCPDCAPCHADILGEAANRPIQSVPDA